MKKTLLSITVACAIILIAISCTKENNNGNTYPVICFFFGGYPYPGKWKLVEEYASIGAGENWQPVTNGFEIEIKQDTTYTVFTSDDLIIGTQGKIVFRNDSTWVTNYSHGIRSVVPEPNIFFLHRDTFLMRSYLTKDGAALKFARITGSAY